MGALAVSVAVGLVDLISKVERDVRRNSKLSALQSRSAAATSIRVPQAPPRSVPNGIQQKPLPQAPFEAIHKEIRPSDRFFVDVAQGTRGPFITDGEIVRDYLSYSLLPAIRVIRPRAATVIVRYRFDGTCSVERTR